MVEYKAPEPQELLAAIVSSSGDAIVSKNLDGYITFWNPAAERIFGYRAEEMIGQHITAIIPPELRGEEDEIIRKIRAGQRIEHFETERVGKNGRRIPLSLTISPVRDGSGRIIGASKIAREMADYQEAARARAHLAAIVDSSDDAIISKDLDGAVTSWNKAAERLYGFSAEEMIGRSIRSIIPPNLQHEEDRIISRIRAGERIYHFETVRLHKAGHFFHVSITVSPIRNEAGRIIGASKIARDITPQRMAQKRKDEFLAILAHELRNPLAPITTALQLLERPEAAQDRKDRALQIAGRQLRHMARLLDDLLDAARITTGRAELRVSTFSLKPVVDEAVAIAGPLMEAKGQRFECSIPSQEVVLQADRARILQLLTNLLTNANKYTPSGGRIDLTAACEGSYLRISVRDTGIGIPQEQIPHLFKLFERGRSAEARREGGLGIGLALVKEFVERHGGEVSVESPGPGAGSTFSATLPVVSGCP